MIIVIKIVMKLKKNIHCYMHIYMDNKLTKKYFNIKINSKLLALNAYISILWLKIKSSMHKYWTYLIFNY